MVVEKQQNMLFYQISLESCCAVQIIFNQFRIEMRQLFRQELYNDFIYNADLSFSLTRLLTSSPSTWGQRWKPPHWPVKEIIFWPLQSPLVMKDLLNPDLAMEDVVEDERLTPRLSRVLKKSKKFLQNLDVIFWKILNTPINFLAASNITISAIMSWQIGNTWLDGCNPDILSCPTFSPSPASPPSPPSPSLSSILTSPSSKPT